MTGSDRERLERLPSGSSAITDADRNAINEVLNRGMLADGTEVSRFERELAEFAGVDEAVAVSSATAGISLTLLAAGIGRGDEVITSPLTFPGTVNAIVAVGARPVFVDVMEDGLALDSEQVIAAVTARTAAVCVVSRLGEPARAIELQRAVSALGSQQGRRIVVIEDGAYRIATIGVSADSDVRVPTIVSLQASKVMTTGLGGAVLGVDAAGARAMRRLRNQGIDEQGSDHSPQSIGFALRMCDLNAALGRSQLRRLGHTRDRHVDVRRALKDALQEQCIGVRMAPGDHHAVFECRVPGLLRNDLRAALWEEGVTTRVHYPLLTDTKPWARFRGESAFPHARRISETTLTLPSSSDTTGDDISELARAVGRGWRRVSASGVWNAPIPAAAPTSMRGMSS